MTAAASSSPLPPAPDAVWGLANGFVLYWTVVAALELGVFEALAPGPLGERALAHRVASRSDRLHAVVAALLAAGFLRRDGDELVLDPVARRHLVAGSTDYLGDLVRCAPGLHQNWAVLAETVRGADPPARPPADFYARLTSATFATQRRVAELVMSRPGSAPDGPFRLLDVGAGAAPWSIAALEQHPDATVVVNDRPEVLAEADARLAARGLTGRATMVAGNYHDVELPPSEVVVLGHLCRGEGATGTRRLLARAARWVVPHGRLIVTDYLLPADGPAAPTVAVMGVTAMANSATGGPLHRDELEGMVRSSGFDRLEHVHVGSTDVVLARRSAP